MKYSVVQIGRLAKSKSFRLDAEYYHPKALEYEDKIVNAFHGESLKASNFSIVSGPFGSTLRSDAYLTDGVPFVRISDLENFIISKKNLIYISKEDNARLSSSKLNVGDIVLSKVGNTIGVASIVTDDIGPCNISENNIGIRMAHGLDMQHKSFIVAYLNSTPGQNQILRAISGNAQPKLNVSDIEQIKVPHVSTTFANGIHLVVAKAIQCTAGVEIKYAHAENQFLSELGISKWQPTCQPYFVRKYSETDSAGRIDADYYQPKYDEIVNAIKSYPGGWAMMPTLVKVKDKIVTPENKAVYKYIELSNIAGNGEITDCMVEEGQDLPSRARRKVTFGDVIVSSIEGSLSSIALIEKEYDQALCSTGFHVINSKFFNSETLLVLLKSIVGQLQLKKGCSGTILTAINKDEFNKVILPKVDETVQAQIQQKVKESFNLRKQSKHLLECAKRAVEIAIEQDEAAAIKWLQEQTSEAGE